MISLRYWMPIAACLLVLTAAAVFPASVLADGECGPSEPANSTLHNILTPGNPG
jgi:hypothetical protein